jgi:hypothetical protein
VGRRPGAQPPGRSGHGRDLLGRSLFRTLAACACAPL